MKVVAVPIGNDRTRRIAEMASRQVSRSLAELKLEANLLRVIADVAGTIGGREGFDSALAAASDSIEMERTAAFTWKIPGNLGWLAAGAAIPHIGGILKSIPAVALGIPLGLGIAGTNAWDWVKRELLGKEHAGEALPYQDVRRTGPRSDSKWWMRDIPSEIGVVPESFYVEDPSYEPWFRKLQEENATRMRSEYGGVPYSFNTIPGYALSSRSTRGPHPEALVPSPAGPPSAFSLYDQLTSPSPDRTSEDDGDGMIVQSQLFTQQPIERPQGVREHPFASIFQPGSLEQAAAIGGEEGWYAPPSPHAPFSDRTGLFGRDDAVEWAPGGTPLETRMNFMRAMQATVPQRLSWGTNWRIGQILAQLHSGMIDREQASRLVHQLVSSLSDMGAPPAVLQDTLDRAFAGMRSGVYGGIPQRMIEGTPIPSADVADWRLMRSPQDDPLRGGLMRNVGDVERRMRNMSGGWRSPAATSPLLEV